MSKRLGFFTRLTDHGGDPGGPTAYRLALEQFVVAEQLGYQVGWVAQHHFDAVEGGLPAPLVFLSTVAARTSAIRLATGIITLPLEDPIRVAEDAAVLDALSGGRLELGFGTGGSPAAFAAFGRDSSARSELFTAHFDRVVAALSGAELAGPGRVLVPRGQRLLTDIWQATFSVHGGRRAGLAGTGLLLSRTQPRPENQPHAPLAEVQEPVVRAYRAALPAGVPARIGASRSVFVGLDREKVRAAARAGVRAFADHLAATGQPVPAGDEDDLLTALDVHCGTPDEVVATLLADPVVTQATDLIFQVHPADPGQRATLESLELIATAVAPHLGWRPGPAAAEATTERTAR
ncbi:putative FMN-dependent luciferase-like monooxygenase [Goodfellowiella coeruleoviolacea]|uniref:FMN-dependent luciferase-like monooxygenase, KPN_01858 family n=1 Tax=Goodfellowiella coeruleoviolacea TaxID=334858 RepID=A0AAE3GHA3_9PSEU|nr:putative FMN-dependent luciferase-like monooxygenase [Goodfellowiella coeruleoviolacea]MCP2167349.1 putative FMN-dependent luciferase-like monooxygenase, KPN_01858 family [Goodfellowiella coeruleoviolacea]